MQIILASNNTGKIKEIKALLSDLPIELISQTKWHIQSVAETGTTFIENALIRLYSSLVIPSSKNNHVHM